MSKTNIMTIDNELFKKTIDLSEYEFNDLSTGQYHKIEKLGDITITTTVFLELDYLDKIVYYCESKITNDQKEQVIEYEYNDYTDYIKISLYVGSCFNQLHSTSAGRMLCTSKKDGVGNYDEIIYKYSNKIKTVKTHISYKGNWVNEMKHGNGIFNIKGFKENKPFEVYYVGEFANDKFNGKGDFNYYEAKHDNEPLSLVEHYNGMFKDNEKILIIDNEVFKKTLILSEYKRLSYTNTYFKVTQVEDKCIIEEMRLLKDNDNIYVEYYFEGDGVVEDLDMMLYRKNKGIEYTNNKKENKISLYKGKYFDNNKEGDGEYKLLAELKDQKTHIEYKGKWKCNTMHAKGIMTTITYNANQPLKPFETYYIGQIETYYVGQFENNKYHGNGKLFTYEANKPMKASKWDNKVYIGTFKEGKYVS